MGLWATNSRLPGETARAPGGDKGPATCPLDDADQASSEFGDGDGDRARDG